MRTTGIRLIVLGSLTMLNAAASQAAFPERPIRWIVPAAAGGGADASVRIIGPEMATLLGQQIVVDNRPGASGTVGIGLVAKAPADGYTLGSGNITNLAMSRTTIKSMPYNPNTDIQAVIQTHFQPNVLLISPAIPAKNPAELIELARKKPDELIYASSGNGSSLHFAGELFQQISGVKFRHVPYNSVPIALNDLLGNRIAMIFNNLSSSVSHIKAGRLVGLAVTSPERSPVMPELPTMAASGLPGYALVVWGGIVAPKGTPAAVIDRLNTTTNTVLANPKVRERLTTLGLQLVGGNAGLFDKLIRSETAKWQAVATRAGIGPQ